VAVQDAKWRELTNLPSVLLEQQLVVFADSRVVSEVVAETTAPRAADENPPRSRRRKLSIEKIRTALLDRARHDMQITQELIAGDLDSTARTMRKTVSGTDWEAEVRRARLAATEDDSANGN
jgi:hypothetical protein